MVPIESMAITDPKEVQSVDITQIRLQDEAVLVHFVRVAWLESYSGGKGKLCDRVEAWLNSFGGDLL
eukprot:CAMPEP_0170566790 /NCGR_PEP_ID=MMETSP0211-20121228/80062_1 /TAXON_ID=311385 /ORGANISM="Pseudokeronopsis sp., Strain OXSARD2" /LENGTH=66 /DNA_ID=CAMNT_0010888059 /DNA_START=822 /DNA_END=1022 /DNA_ORIENTATION=-